MIYDFLSLLSIPYEKFEHPPVFTCAEADRYCQFPGGRTKNLFLRNKQGSKHVLVVVPSDKQVNLAALSEQLGLGRLSFASSARLYRYLRVEPGSVSPLALVYDVGREVLVIVDQDLSGHETLQFHPGENTSTLVIRWSNLSRYLDHLGHQWRIEEIPGLQEST